MRLRKDRWNTYWNDGFRHSITNDQASAGGVVHYQIKKNKQQWIKRICQSNGWHFSYTPIENISDEEGEKLYAEYKTQRQKDINIRQQMRKEYPNSGW